MAKEGDAARLLRLLGTIASYTKGAFPLLELRMKSMLVNVSKLLTLPTTAKDSN